MSRPFFMFKQFTVWHDRCAMKVGTDGVLLGAWADVEGAARVLDIGTGCGLIALMAAQRSKARVTAVEIDGEAAAQAAENVARSRWRERVEVVKADLKGYEPECRFDAILSNPPYFSGSLTCPQEARSRARHDEQLSFRELLEGATRLLAPGGEVSVILPAGAVEEFVGLAVAFRLSLSRRMWVQTLPGAEPKRCLLAFRSRPVACAEEGMLPVRQLSGEPTEAYRALTRDFYLKV